ncbi:MAG: S-layer homology domain-containing protein, partial [Candidatus Peregrinibacteria bacterium]
NSSIPDTNCLLQVAASLLDYKKSYDDTATACKNSKGQKNSPRFSDVDNYKFKDAINFLKQSNTIEGYSDGTYRPNNKINRAEFTKILMIPLYKDLAEQYSNVSCFNDVTVGSWYSKYVCLAKAKNIIGGYDDGAFKPSRNINAAEALKITFEVIFGEVPPIEGAWYQKYWNYAKDNHYLVLGWYSPSQEITRGEMAELIYRIVKDVSEE